MEIKCPLCLSNQEQIIPSKGRLNRKYFHCKNCDLFFTHPNDLPDNQEEKYRYEKHKNTIEAPGYVKFLNQAIKPALPYLSAPMQGLDYGSGPGPTLSILLRHEGISCKDYDPLFGPELPDGPFDFIFSTEAFEHFHSPRKEMNRIDQLLKPGGYLIVMTMFHTGFKLFQNWFYAGDHTHVIFFSIDTFSFICQQWNYQHLWNDDKRVIILQKNKYPPRCEKM